MTKKLIALFVALLMALPLAACGSKGADVTGKYICVGLSYDGEALADPGDGSYLELKKGGKGTYYSGFEFDLKWTLDGEAFSGTVSFLGLDQGMEGTLKDGVIDVKYGDMTMRFVKEGMSAPETAGAGAEAPAAVDMTVADTLAEAFSGAAGATDVTVENPSNWYGWIELTDIWGYNVSYELSDAWGSVGTETSTGRQYFEVFKDGDSENAFLSMYASIEDGGTRIVPEIGDEDAWLLENYLTGSDAADYEIALNDDGALTFSVDYVKYDDSCGFHMEMFLRPDGVLWDESVDTLPPRYDEYKAALAESAASSGDGTTGEYGKTTASATGIVDLAKLKAGFDWLKNHTGSANNYYEPTYEEVMEQFGVDGHKANDEYWTDEYHIYEWITVNDDFALITFEVLGDGSERYSGVSWSPSLGD